MVKLRKDEPETTVGTASDPGARADVARAEFRRAITRVIDTSRFPSVLKDVSELDVIEAATAMTRQR